jgi:hypothetical protein
MTSLSEKGLEKSIILSEASCMYWSDNNGGMNVIFVKTAENDMNVSLRIRGFLTLRDVYSKLGLRKPAIHAEDLYWGWKYDPDDPELFKTRIELNYEGKENPIKFIEFSNNSIKELEITLCAPHNLISEGKEGLPKYDFWHSSN